MRMEELKRGFWGYQKEGVYRCITSMEEEFSARLMEKDAALAKLEEQYQARVRELEEALARAQEENRAQSRSQAAISEALLRAQLLAALEEQMDQGKVLQTDWEVTEQDGMLEVKLLAQCSEQIGRQAALHLPAQRPEASPPEPEGDAAGTP